MCVTRWKHFVQIVIVVGLTLLLGNTLLRSQSSQKENEGKKEVVFEYKEPIWEGNNMKGWKENNWVRSNPDRLLIKEFNLKKFMADYFPNVEYIIGGSNGWILNKKSKSDKSQSLNNICYGFQCIIYPTIESAENILFHQALCTGVAAVPEKDTITGTVIGDVLWWWPADSGKREKKDMAYERGWFQRRNVVFAFISMEIPSPKVEEWLSKIDKEIENEKSEYFIHQKKGEETKLPLIKKVELKSEKVEGEKELYKHTMKIVDQENIDLTKFKVPESGKDYMWKYDKENNLFSRLLNYPLDNFDFYLIDSERFVCTNIISLGIPVSEQSFKNLTGKSKEEIRQIQKALEELNKAKPKNSSDKSGSDNPEKPKEK